MKKKKFKTLDAALNENNYKQFGTINLEYSGSKK